MKKNIRILVVTEVILLACGFIAAISTERFLPDILQTYIRQTAAAKYTALQLISLPISLVLLLLMVIAWISVWRFSRHARLLYTLYCAVLLPYTVISGPYVCSGAAMAFSVADTLIAGMILGILYFGNDSSLIQQQSNKL